MESFSHQQPFLIAQQLKTSKDFPFLALDMQDDTCIPPRKVFQILHKHEEIEFIYVLENKLQIQTPMSNITIHAGQGAFIPKNVLHVLNTFGNCKCKGFLFPDSLLVPEIYPELYPAIKSYTENPMMDLVLITDTEKEAPILDKLRALDKSAYDRPQSDMHSFKLLSRIYDLWFTFTTCIEIASKSVTNQDKVKGDRLKTYLEYIQLNYHQTLTVEMIADSAFTSVSECNRTFKSLLKVTAYDYLIQYRMNQSLDLIKSQQFSIEEVAYRAGYNSPSQFTKYFKKHMGLTPLQYMKTWRNKG